MAKLYMLEVLIDKVIFDEMPVPLKKDILIQATCPKLGSLEIRTDAMGDLENLEAKERSSKKKDVDIDCGRSILFPMDAQIKNIMQDESLEVTVSSKQDPEPRGIALLKWPPEFIAMVESSLNTSGYLTPVIYDDQFVMNKDGQRTALINMYMKLSYLGHNVYTNIQKIVTKEAAGAPDEPATYLFKSIDGATIFRCERHGMGTDEDIVPVAAIYNVGQQRQHSARGGALQFKSQGTKSTETLLTMNNAKFSTTSMTPSVFFGMGATNRTAMLQNLLSSGSSTMSIRSPQKLKGQKYMDLTELHMDVSTFSILANALGMHVYQADHSSAGGEGEEGEDGEDGFLPLFVDYKALTVEEIEHRLCKHPDCPAAKKFKEFGIGPLAKNITGLGGMYNDVQAPCSYGLSHCNGTIDDYGPLGRFKRPKKAEEPFVPQSDCKCARKKSSTTSSVSTGSNTKDTKGKSACYARCPVNPMKKDKPMRLRGGADSPECDPPPNPVTMCQDLMDEFNKVLKEYKDALGPCGQATCPFALNVIGDACQDICNSTDPEYQRTICDLANANPHPDAGLQETAEFTGCGVLKCPYKRAAISPAEREYSKYKGMPGCGFTKCPFVKAKLGMEPDEENHLPPFQDYQKQETYKYHDALPPIHWDCPDPLPKGDCKNPDCPFVKRDALIKKYFPEPCCPCGSPACPYVCAPCTFPGCPFAIAEPCPPVCPYTEPPPKELKCTASICPFVRNTEARCQNPDCPYRQYEEKLAECAAWERHQALLAEEEEQGEDEPCKPCGRGKSQRARCSNSKSKSKSLIVSTSRLQTTSNMTGTNFASESCVLSGAVDKRDKDAPCKPGTCGVDQVCAECKPIKSEKSTPRRKSGTVGKDLLVGLADKPEQADREEKAVSITKSDDIIMNDQVQNKTLSFKTHVSSMSSEMKKVKRGVKKGGILKQPDRDPVQKILKTPNNLRGPNKATKRVAMGPLGPHKCRKLHNFTFDHKSYKPCTKIGHRECVLPKFLVPKCMGWLWNIHENVCGLRPRRGWKPGAMSKMIAFRIDYFNAMREKRPFGQRKSKSDILGFKPSQPTLQIHKKAGVVDVKMLPIKDPREVQKIGDGNPYMDCTPIQFKITKNDPSKQAKYCFCGDELSDTDSSELDIEFSPPGALKNPRLMHKQPLVEEEVQYNINDVALPEKKKKKKDGFWSGVQKVLKKLSDFYQCNEENLTAVLRLRGGGATGPNDKACGTDETPEVPTTASAESLDLQPAHGQDYKSLFPFCFWRHFIAWRVMENSFSLRILFMTLNINIVEELPEEDTTTYPDEYIPLLRLRGGGEEDEDDPCYDVNLSVQEVFQNGNFGNSKSNVAKSLRLRGGSPAKRKTLKTPVVPRPADLCKDLMDDFDKLMVDYKKALGPCGKATCPLNYNVLEEECRKVCQVTCPQPYCPPKLGPCEKPLCPHMGSYSDYCEDEENLDEWTACYASCVADRPDGTAAVPCGRSVCPFGLAPPELCTTFECPQMETCEVDTCKTPPEPCGLRNPLKEQVKCNKHICPYKKDSFTVDDVNQLYRKPKSRKGCGSPFCPHSNKYPVEPEVLMPPFPCKRPCPSMDDLPPIHWDCPDPLPQGECTNPYCPLREKLPCGHCPIDARHCGMPGCQFAGDSLCPPTCPYTQKNPPKDLECRPSICPLVRPAGYKPPVLVSRKDKPCGDRCPYAKGNIHKKTCGNPDCPYNTCIDTDEQGMPKAQGCGNPCCPYQAAAKKRAEKEKKREEEKEKAERGVVFLPAPQASPQTTEYSGGTSVGTPSKLLRAEKDSDDGKKSNKMSKQNIRKLMETSMMILNTLPADTADTGACQQLTCSQYMGDRICKKCVQRQREAKAAGTDLMALSAKKDASANKHKTKGSRKKKKHRSGYVYDKGTYYPGVKFGHRDCNHHPKRIPWDMGWKWNVRQPYDQLKQRPGWRPGAIGKTMLKFINGERKKLGLSPRPMIRDPMPRKRFSKDDSNAMIMRRSKTRFSHTRLIKPKPTLTIKKKDGVVYVTMNPLKDPKDMEVNEYPYIDCSPLEFKIIKKKADDEAKQCMCDGGGENFIPESDASSELDIEFTPPAGIIRPDVMGRTKHVCHSEAQYNPKDLPKVKSKKGKGKKGKGKKGKKGKKAKKGKKGGKKGKKKK